MSRLLAAEEIALYRRFQEALRPEDRPAFCRQIALATIDEADTGYTRFGFSSATPTFDTEIYRNNLVKAYYDDLDGQVVHVILHLSLGYVSWVERFRIDVSRSSSGRSMAEIQMLVPPAADLRFVRDRYALPPVSNAPDALPRLLTARERELYGRFADAMRTDDLGAFAGQVAIATIIKHDSSHTTFGNTNTAPTFDDQRYGSLIDAFYDDADGATVHVILHFASGVIAWIERYRLDMTPIQMSVPNPADLRFVMIKM